MKLRLAPRAVQDLANIANYIRARNPSAAQHVRTTIFQSLQNLILFPRAGREQTISGVRKLVTPRYSYLIYYTVDEVVDEIVVVAIQHPARQREYEDL